MGYPVISLLVSDSSWPGVKKLVDLNYCDANANLIIVIHAKEKKIFFTLTQRLEYHFRTYNAPCWVHLYCVVYPCPGEQSNTLRGSYNRDSRKQSFVKNVSAHLSMLPRI